MGWQDAPLVEKAAWESAPIVEQQEQEMVQLSVPSQPSSPEPSGRQPQGGGIAEAGLQVGTGLASSIAGGLYGLGTLATGGGGEQAAQNIRDTQEKFTYQPRTLAGQTLSNALAYPIEKATEGWGEIGELVGGDAGRAIGETGFQSAAILAGRPWRLGAKPPVTEANLLGQLNKTVKKGLDKSKTIAPVKKSSIKQIDKAYADASEAIQSIVKRKDELTYYDEIGPIASGRVPKNLGEFSQSISQLKEVVYNKYNKMMKEAEGAGVKISFDSIVPELEAIINDPGMKTTSPAITKYAKTQLEALQKQKSFTPEVAQSTIARLNKELDAYNKNPNPQLTNKMGVKAIIANHLRRNLDATIETTTGSKYQPLKNEYGALSSIEKSVNIRKLRDDQATGTSALNFYDVFSAHDLIGGALTGNIVQMGKGAGLAAIAKKIKIGKDPNIAIRKMFQESEKTVKKLQKLMPREQATATVTAIEPMMQLEGGQNRLALPAPQQAIQLGEGPRNPTIPMGGPTASFRPLTSWERMFEIAQSPKGKQLLVERLGREAKHAELVAELVKVPEIKAIPYGQSYRVPTGQVNPLGR